MHTDLLILFAQKLVNAEYYLFCAQRLLETKNYCEYANGKRKRITKKQCERKMYAAKANVTYYRNRLICQAKKL